MAYFEGFVTAVPTANKDAYLKHATDGQAMMKEHGVTRMVENWGDDVAQGEVTDFQRAVQAKPEETVLFSWFEYPDRKTRDAANEKMMADPRMEQMAESMPFDGKRMIYGGFDAILDEGNGGKAGYTDGMVTPVPEANKDAYLELARKTSKKFRDLGAVRVVEAWGDDIPDGKVTDYRRAVKAESGETVAFSFIQWPDKATRDGKDMAKAQDLLAKAISSVVGKKEEKAVASLFTAGGTHAQKGEFAGSNDFEVVAWLAILSETAS